MKTFTMGRDNRAKAQSRSQATDVKDYLAHVEVGKLTSVGWPLKWARFHGDCKSKTSSKFHIETMKGDDSYVVKIVPGHGPYVVADGSAAEPTIDDVVKCLSKNVLQK